MDNRATHRQLVKVAHVVLAAGADETLARMKDTCARFRLGWRYSGELTAALNSAAWQRSPRQPFRRDVRRGARR